MKRNTRTYKIPDSFYHKALKRGKGLLATMIEGWVSAYGQGAEIKIAKPHSKQLNKKQ